MPSVAFVEDSGEAVEPVSTVAFDAIVGFLDIAGFTAATERFGRAGARGTEALGQLINSLFTPAIAEVHAGGGEIGWFAGDAIGILFDREITSDERAVAALLAASATLTALTPAETAVGSVELGVKLGVAAGPIRWNTLEVTPSLAWYSGDAVDLAAAAEHHASPGDVIIHESVRAGVAASPVDADGRGEFRRVDVVAASVVEPVDGTPLSARRSLDHQPPRVARLARAGDVALLDQHRAGTAVFVGMPGTTIDPRMLARVAAISVELGGIVLSASEGDKGATALVFLGAPTALADRQRRALLLAAAIRAEFAEVTCGVASGRVFAGRVGSDARWDYSVLGDRVNVAARLMQAAAPGEILVDQSTLVAAGAGVELGEHRELALKGKSEPEHTSTLIAVADQVGEIADVGPFVGRAAELADLREALDRPGVTVVLGDPGIGKSRLLRRALANTAPEAQVRVLLGEADRLRPFRLWRRVLEACEVTDQATAEGVVGEARAPLVDLLMGRAAVRSPLLDDTDDDDRAELLASVVVDVLRAAAATSVVVEDLHWADATSIELVTRLAGRLVDARIALVATSRAEPHVDVVVRAPGTTVRRIDELGDDAIAALAESLWTDAFGAAPVPSLTGDLVERSSGSPLYCHQLVSWAAVRGEPADLEMLGDEVPGTINDLMLARLDAVPEEAEPAISYGSVLAEPFETAELTEAFGDRAGGELIPGAVEILLDRQLFVGFARHRFAHSLMREIAYGRLSFELRQELHSAALALLERAGSDDVGELARHAAETTDVERQRRYFSQAAEHAADRYANDVASDWYQRLLPLVDPPESGRVRIALGRLEYVAGELDVASVLLSDAIREVDGVERERAILALGRVQIARGDPSGFDRIDEVIDLAEAREDWEMAREALDVAADLATMLGDFDRAEAAESRHAAWVERLGSTHAMARPVPFLSGLVWMRGDLDAAAARYQEVYEQFLEDGDLIHAGASAADLGGINYERGDVTAALDWLEVGARCFETVGHERSIVRLIRGNEVLIRTDLGDLTGARRLGLAAADRALFLGDLATVGEILAAVVPAAASLDEALALLDGAERTARVLGLDADEYLGLLRARAHARFGDLDAAIALAEPMAAEDDDPELSVDLARWHLARGEDPQLVEALDDRLEGADASPVLLFRLADALADATGTAKWNEIARARAQRLVHDGVPAGLREAVGRWVEQSPDVTALPPPEVGDVDVDTMLEQLRIALPTPTAASASPV